ncbi:hypothetical protein EV182_001648 [Spiromyces aspiralis]|uniref:Uncharacterized protein n=1 Tax=Spiromyces aspiralis TaxID=68401 RepID=A0ACC1HHX1_9FUNG|nr:hypothetical protein EV182_001648 [Spiromyces aspiralis]
MRILPLLVAQLATCLVSQSAVAEIQRVINPLNGTKWHVGSREYITFRYTGPTGNDAPALEIDLITGDPDNAELVAILDSEFRPNQTGVNRVYVNVPSDVTPADGYSVRVGNPLSEYDWNYSQQFSIVQGSSKGSSSNSSSSDDDNDDNSGKNRNSGKDNDSTADDDNSGNNSNKKDKADLSVEDNHSGATATTHGAGGWPANMVGRLLFDHRASPLDPSALAARRWWVQFGGYLATSTALYMIIASTLF